MGEVGKHKESRGNTCSRKGCNREARGKYKTCYACRESRELLRKQARKRQERKPSPLFGLVGWSR